MALCIYMLRVMFTNRDVGGLYDIYYIFIFISFNFNINENMQNINNKNNNKNHKEYNKL
jgi:hypothetical protein